MVSRLWLSLAVCLLATLAHAQKSPQMLAKPKSGYVLDKAHLLSKAAVDKINRISTASIKDSQSPIYVVTIPSLSSVNGVDIVTYANELFDVWGVGSKKFNRGILLLVSKGDRKARIALGADWRYDRDEECQSIMNSVIIPLFKKGNYQQGMINGAEALRDMANTPVSTAQPYAGSSPSGENELRDMRSEFLPLVGVFACCPCSFFILVALIAGNRGGGGGGFGGGGGNTWYRSTMFNSGSSFGGSSHSSGGFSSGGSSGGGFSGGGGASGSW